MIGMKGGGLYEGMLQALPGDEPLTLSRWYSCRLSQLYETFRGGSLTVTILQLRAIMGKFSFFFFFYFVFLPLFYYPYTYIPIAGWGRVRG